MLQDAQKAAGMLSTGSQYIPVAERRHVAALLNQLSRSVTGNEAQCVNLRNSVHQLNAQLTATQQNRSELERIKNDLQSQVLVAEHANQAFRTFLVVAMQTEKHRKEQMAQAENEADQQLELALIQLQATLPSTPFVSILE